MNKVYIDLNAWHSADEPAARMLLSELDNAGVSMVCVTELSRVDARALLSRLGIMQFFDDIFHMEKMMRLPSTKLRDMADAMLIDRPEDMNYKHVVTIVGKHQRGVSYWLSRLPKAVDSEDGT